MLAYPMLKTYATFPPCLVNLFIWNNLDPQFQL